jgi:uncharacterized iron-regulated membrane protein
MSGFSRTVTPPVTTETTKTSLRVTLPPDVTIWQRWMRQPQSFWIRKALFQIHLWTGIGVGLYILVISVTGSAVVYSGELYRWATPPRLVIVAAGLPMTDDHLRAAAERAYPGYRVTKLYKFSGQNAPVEIALEGGGTPRLRLFDPYTGKDLRDSVPFRIRLVAGLVDLHANLLAGTTGRVLNGIGGLLCIVLGLTGVIVWWPGVSKWRRRLTLHRRVGWKRFNWDLHSTVGCWSFVFMLLFGVTGVYLSFPEAITHAFDRIEPQTDANLGTRSVDRVLYWLAYLHFGRFGGWKTSIPWIIFGLAPAMLFVTSVVMWWNRVLWPRLRFSPTTRRPEAAGTATFGSGAQSEQV